MPNVLVVCRSAILPMSRYGNYISQALLHPGFLVDSADSEGRWGLGGGGWKMGETRIFLPYSLFLRLYHLYDFDIHWEDLNMVVASDT